MRLIQQMSNKRLFRIKSMSLLIQSPQKKKRVRYSIPGYKKVYSVYQYDRLKYSAIFKRVQQLALKYSPEIFKKARAYKVLDLCYIKDEFGKLKRLGDEKHIFRYKILNDILKEIADYLLIAYELLTQTDVLLYLFRKTHIILYYQQNGDCQAELFETCNKDIQKRLKIHITLLRYLQKGLEIEEAVNMTRLKHNLPFLNSLEL